MEAEGRKPSGPLTHRNTGRLAPFRLQLLLNIPDGSRRSASTYSPKSSLRRMVTARSSQR